MQSIRLSVCVLGSLVSLHASVLPASAQDDCKHPLAVNSFAQINRSTLALRNNYGLSAIENQCSLLDRRSFGSRVQFYIMPQSVDNADSVYVFIKSYRTLTSSPPDQIKVSRGEGWYLGPAGSPVLKRLNDTPFQGSLEDWNRANASRDTPEKMAQALGIRWHAYATGDLSSPSTASPRFWQARSDFDYAHGTLTNYLIRFPSDGKAPAPFEVGLPQGVKEFTLEVYSNADGLNGTYRFVLQ